jgi:hypothetical protein
MEKEAQPYYDVVHSKKFGYLFIQYFPEGDGDNFMTPLEDSHDLLFKLFSWITLDVLALDLAGERMTTEIFPVEAEEIQNRIYPILEKCGERCAEFKELLDRFLENYPDIFLYDEPF